MVHMVDTTAWTCLLLGLFLLASAVGELRRSGTWRTMLGEIEASPSLQFMVGMVELALGAAVYLANPWSPQDLLACFMVLLGGLMMIEAVIFIAIADLYLRFWMPRIGTNWRGWAVVSLLIGLWLNVAAIHRFL